MNATDTATMIKRGDFIATFHPKDLEHTPILHMHDYDDAPTTEAPPPEGIELDAALASHPYLKDLSLLQNCEHLDSSQTLALKQLVLKYHRSWDLSPKTVAPNILVCDIRLREGTEFDNQGTIIPMNPATHDKLRELIQHKLKR
jgi:hypothetical protein